MKTIYHTETPYGETEYFFNDKFECIASWNRNDANYRPEYMDPLIEALGFKVKWIEYDDKRVHEYIKQDFIDQGLDIEE